MKTIIKIQKTGNRKYKKVIVNVFALLISLILNNSTASSQDCFETRKFTDTTVQRIEVRVEQPNLPFGLLASLNRSVIVHSSPIIPVTSSFGFEPMAEKSLEIESWMTEISNFGSVANYAVEKEAALELEEWMMNGQNFGNEGEGRPKDGEGKLEAGDRSMGQ